ncbi:MAG: hypothetical protein ACXWLS_10780, partial [Myxococcaceae bacterium]
GRASATPGRVAGRDGGGGGARGATSADASAAGRSLWILRDGKPVPVQVTVGVSDGTFTEVVSGSLQAGDAVLTGVESAGRAATPASPPGGPVRRPF